MATMAMDKDFTLQEHPTFMQHTIGVQFTELEKLKLLQDLSADFGHRATSPITTPETATTTPASTGGQASTSSAAGPTPAAPTHAAFPAEPSSRTGVRHPAAESTPRARPPPQASRSNREP